jgi:site-specific recombinase XerD
MTGIDKVTFAKCNTRALPLDLWPETDRTSWIAACQPPARLKPGGRAGHLRQTTRDHYAERYACFLGFLQRTGLLQSEGAPAVNVTPDKVDAYLADLKGRVASTTTHDSISTLRLVAQIIAPGGDLRWLSEIEKDLALMKQPRSKFDRLVLAEVLVEAGLTLMHEAELSETMTDLERACQFRNGLMVALLGFCPIRRKNFTALEIGRSFVKIRGKWWIVLSASETKEKRVDERTVDELLTPFIDRYVNQYRQVLARSDNPPSALWLSAKDGTPLTYNHVTDLTNATTLATVGVKVSPHLFRTSAVSSAAHLAGENPYLGSALLRHTDPDLTNKHYNRATSLSAAESFRQVIRRMTNQVDEDPYR